MSSAISSIKGLVKKYKVGWPEQKGGWSSVFEPLDLTIFQEMLKTFCRFIYLKDKTITPGRTFPVSRLLAFVYNETSFLERHILEPGII